MANQGHGRRGPSYLALAVLVVAVGLVAWLATRAPDGEGARFIYLAVLLVFLGGSFLWRRRTPLSRSLRHAGIWLLLGGTVFVAYSFRDEARYVLDRVQGDLTPERGYSAGQSEISFRAGPGGHFAVEAQVDGVALVFLVDTGATEVVLTREDARKLGLDPDRLAYTRAYQTANGTVMGAPVVLDEIAVGPVVVRDVKASVNSASMDGSLLGMSFLARTGGYRVNNDVLTLYVP